MLVHLLLDLDGTLIDSSSGIYHSFCFACDQFNLPRPSFSLFRGMIGPPIQEILEKIYPGLDSEFVDSFRVCFRHHYDVHGFSDFTWYPGVISCLNSLWKDESIRMSIVTNKPTQPSIEILNSQNLLPAFERVVGIDYLLLKGEGSIFVSKSIALEYVTRTTLFSAQTSLYVGDTLGDYMSCCHVGLPFIPALYGFHEWSAVHQFSRSISYFSQIREHLTDIKYLCF